MYDDWFKLVRDGETIATTNDFTQHEQQEVDAIKMLITDPEKVKMKEEQYSQLMAERRETLSHHFEHPVPVESKHATEESNTEEYQG